MTESIEDLRQRWDEDPTPQLALRLAEEYGRLERHADAVFVLGQALQEHPEHVAARVALGRYRLELGDADEACEILEQVVAEDPTHLVANKLLVGLYIDNGQEKQAQDRLDLYKLLNEGDEEIEVLERRIRGEEPPTEPTVPQADPFAGLWISVGDQAYWQAVGAEGIFPVAARDTQLVVTAPEPPVTGATVTLANLYLQQGHLDDAEQVYREVLDREPENQEAIAGLGDILQRREQRVDGVEMPTMDFEMVGGDATTRKIAVLREYLQRIRTAAEQ